MTEGTLLKNAECLGGDTRVAKTKNIETKNKWILGKTLFSGHYTKYTQIIYSKTVLPEKLVFVQLLGHLNVLFL